MKQTLFLQLLVALLLVMSGRGVSAGDLAWPSEAWPTATPESVGIDSQRLVDALTVLRERGVPVHGLAVVRHGKLALDVSFYPFSAGGLHDIASCTKSVTALGIGAAIDRGLLAGPEAKLVEVFAGKKLAKLDDKKQAIRIADLLTMRSGLFCLQDALSQMQMFQSPNWMQFCLDLPANRPPGAHFQYFSLNSHLLSGCVQQVSGKPLADYVAETVFEPIGLKKFGWPADPQQASHGWGDLRLSSHDMARLGWLILQDGRWNDRQIVSRKWVAEMLQPRVEVGQGRLFPQYGYQIWLGEQGFCFKGRGGQRIMGLPKQDLVIVSIAGVSDAEEVILDEQLTAIGAAAAGAPLTENPTALAELHSMVAAVRLAPRAEPPPSPPEIARQIDGVQFEMEPNLYARQIAFRQTSATEGRFEIALPALHRHPDLSIQVGLDGAVRMSPGRYGELAAATARWEEGGTLVIDMDELANINRWTWRLTFTPTGVTMDVSERTDLPRLRTKGRRTD